MLIEQMHPLKLNYFFSALLIPLMLLPFKLTARGGSRGIINKVATVVIKTFN